jgi:hypothetical protein
MITSKMIRRWTCRMRGEARNAYKLWLEILYEIDQLRNLGIRGKLTLNWILENEWVQWRNKTQTARYGHSWWQIIVKVKVKLSLCFNWAPRHEGLLGGWGEKLHSFELGTRWRWVVSFTARQLYPEEKSLWFQLDRRLGARFTTSWRSEIHINLKIDAYALNRHRRRFCVRRTIYHIYHGQRRQYADKCACVYGVCSVKNKIENETKLTDCNSNLTYPNLT